MVKVGSSDFKKVRKRWFFKLFYGIAVKNLLCTCILKIWTLILTAPINPLGFSFGLNYSFNEASCNRPINVKNRILYKLSVCHVQLTRQI